MKTVFLLILSIILSSSLYGQQVLIPYRLGNVWGLADTLGKVVVEPKYSKIERTDKYVYGNEKDNLFIVQKNNKYGIIKESKLILDTKYNNLHADSMFIIERNNIRTSRKTILYNLKGEQLLKDSVNSIEAIQGGNNIQKLYRIAYGPKNNVGIIWYNPIKQSIEQWIVKDVFEANAYSYENIFDLYLYETNNRQVKKYDMLFDTEKNKYALLPATNSRKEPQIKGDNSPLYEGNSRVGSYSEARKTIIKTFNFFIKGNKILLKTSNRNLYYNTSSKTDTLSFNIDFEKAEVCNYGDEGFIAHQFKIDAKSIDTVFNRPNYIKFKKNNKFGILGAYKPIPAVYDSIRYFSNGINYHYFIVGKFSKTGIMQWGVVSADNKEILPCIYDDIVRKYRGDFWLLRQGNKYGLTDFNGKVEFPVDESRFEPSSDYSSFSIEKKNKYGFINPYSKCNPVLAYKITRNIAIGSYTVFEVIDKNNKVLGNGDKKGFLYFKN
ncbi:WG repeat-containing protein [Pedobacter zeae]|uniref:WG containing repeat-containing protein n=1 Tax=Pedobacter zeae TaxID=1737356 RepID=A0A7W6KG97_9SPHI|nr:WG repeat-containing protein [Pedobacter zeae]MBB4110281.1 hypothetical protein [Pedobacter zeae]